MRVRIGVYGRGHPIKVGGVTDALAAISKTIELDGQPRPLYRSDKQYQLFLERDIKGFRTKKPPTVPQLEVTVKVPRVAFVKRIKSLDPLIRQIGCLIIIAFYFLLRGGEYTKPKMVVRNGKRVPATRTKQFVV